MIVEFLPYLSFNVFPGPEAYVLYGLILIALVFFMPGGIVAGVRLLKAKVVRVVPRLPDVQRAVPGSWSPRPTTPRRLAKVGPGPSLGGALSAAGVGRHATVTCGVRDHIHRPTQGGAP